MPSIQFVHAPIHSPEQVREIVREAGDIADETEYEGRLWEAVFGKACDLLGQRVSAALPPEAVPFDLAKIRSGG